MVSTLAREVAHVGNESPVAADKAGSIVNAQGVLVKRPSRIHVGEGTASV